MNAMMRLLLGGNGDAVRTIRHGKSVAWRCKLGSTWWQEGTEGRARARRPPLGAGPLPQSPAEVKTQAIRSLVHVSK